MHRILTKLLVATSCAACMTANATCRFIGDYHEESIPFVLPHSINVPADALIGKVIYADDGAINTSLSYICNSDFQIGSVDGRGQKIASGLYPIGDTGIAWRYRYRQQAQVQYPGGPKYVPSTNTLFSVPNGFELVKVGQIKPGAKIPAGILGYLNIGGLIALNLSVTEMNIVAASCQTPDEINVSLGQPTLSSIFDDPAPDYHSFTIPLTNCPSGINKVVYRLIPTATSPIVDSLNGVIGLNPQSTAKGMGIRIRNAVDQSFKLEHSVRAGEFTPGTSQYDIKMSAQYYPLPGARRGDMKPGTANAEIMFLIEYL